MAQVGFTFHIQRNHLLPYYHKEPAVFPYLGQYPSTLWLLDNPDTDSYQDFSSDSLQIDSDTLFEPLSPHTSLKTNAQHKRSLHSTSTHQNFPLSSPLNDILDKTLDSKYSDFEILKNSMYHSTSCSTHSFLQCYPHVANSPNLSWLLKIFT